MADGELYRLNVFKVTVWLSRALITFFVVQNSEGLILFFCPAPQNNIEFNLELYIPHIPDFIPVPPPHLYVYIGK